jgi:hypothetical protein
MVTVVMAATVQPPRGASIVLLLVLVLLWLLLWLLLLPVGTAPVVMLRRHTAVHG